MSLPSEPPPPNAPRADDPDEHPGLAAANARAGMALFAAYLALYGGFVGLSAFAPRAMAREAWGGLNLAVVYGLALIGAAVALAFVYMGVCRRIADRHAAGGDGR